MVDDWQESPPPGSGDTKQKKTKRQLERVVMYHSGYHESRSREAKRAMLLAETVFDGQPSAIPWLKFTGEQNVRLADLNPPLPPLPRPVETRPFFGEPCACRRRQPP